MEVVGNRFTTTSICRKVNSNTVSPQSSVTEESRPFKTASKLQSCIVSNDGPSKEDFVFGASSSVSRPQTSSLDLKAAAQHRYKITAKPKPSATIGIGFKDYDEINREWLQMIEEPIVTIKKPQTKKSRAITLIPKYEERSIPNGIYITLVRTAVRDTSSPATRGLLIPKHLGEFRTGAVRIKGMDIGNGGKHMSKESLTQSLPLVVGYKASGQSMPAIGVALEDQPNYDAHRTESSLWVSTNALLSQFALPPSHSYHTHMQSSRAELPSTVDTTHLPTVATHSGPISNCTSLVQAIGTTTEWVAGSIARLTTKKLPNRKQELTVHLVSS
ncbi:hypothetical protein BSLG_005743 [Batrachochytrium salamandrivorans]|nr:hypothetical protein BSLG_005743 [Batrachochytrium salamandrivorans]